MIHRKEVRLPLHGRTELSGARGCYAPLAVWVSLQTFPIPSGIAVYYRDVTQLKEAEAKRNDSAQRLQQVFEATSNAIFLLDRDFNFTFLNRRAPELLAAGGDPVGKNLWALYPATVYPDPPYVKAYEEAMFEKKAGTLEAYYPEPFNFWVSVPIDHGANL